MIHSEKRTDWAAALANVDWDSALADVDWSTVSYTYSSGQTFGDATSAAAVAVTTEAPAAPVAAVEASTTAVAVPATTEAPTTLATSATAAVAAVSSAAATVATTSSSSSLVSDILTSVEETALQALGIISAGTNALTSTEDVYIGTDGPYTMEICNSASEDLYLVAWGSAASWINVQTPLVTLLLPAGSSKTLSFKDGASGALSAIYSDTELVDGQVSNTWIEFTMSNEGVFDISREVNMNGHSVEVVGPECTSNMSTCVFQCTDSSVTSCEFDYELVNCANGSQEGAQFGTFDGADSGGCGGLGTSAAMTATFL